MRTYLLRSVFSVSSPLRRGLSSQAPLVGVTVNDQTGVGTVTLQRPPVNSINLELTQSLLSAIQDLEKNKSRGIILTSVRKHDLRRISNKLNGMYLPIMYLGIPSYVSRITLV